MSKVSVILPVASAIIPKLHENSCDSMHVIINIIINITVLWTAAFVKVCIYILHSIL